MRDLRRWWGYAAKFEGACWRTNIHGWERKAKEGMSEANRKHKKYRQDLLMRLRVSEHLIIRHIIIFLFLIWTFGIWLDSINRPCYFVEPQFVFPELRYVSPLYFSILLSLILYHSAFHLSTGRYYVITVCLSRTEHVPSFYNLLSSWFSWKSIRHTVEIIWVQCTHVWWHI